MIHNLQFFHHIERFRLALRLRNCWADRFRLSVLSTSSSIFSWRSRILSEAEKRKNKTRR